MKRETLTTDGVILFDRVIYRLLFVKEDGETYEPVYPFVSNLDDTIHLEMFIEDFYEELIEHYIEGERHYFSRFLYGFNSDRREAFKQYWFERGLMID